MTGSSNHADIELLDQCLAGNKTAREDFAVRVSRMIYVFAMQKAPLVGLSLNTEDLKDFNHDLLVSLFEDDCRRLRGFSRRSTLSGWIRVLVANALIDLKRSKDNQMREHSTSLHKPVSAGEDSVTWEDILPDLGSNPREQLLYKNLVESVRTARDEVLSDEEKVIVDLWCTRRYTEKEMSVLLDRNENTIATIISRAQAKILAYLKNKEGDSVK